MRRQIPAYTEQQLFSKWESEKLCYVIEKQYDRIDASSDVTDDLEEAKELAKEYEQRIFVYLKKYVKECLDPDDVLQDLLDHVEQNGYDSAVLYDQISETEEKKFKNYVRNWFDRIVKNSWIADYCVGVLIEE